MKSKPMIESTPMVQAILKGLKTQARRPVKIEGQIKTDKNDKTYFKVQDECGDGHDLMEYCPYEIGQDIWIREAFGIIQPSHATAGGKPIDPFYVYKADGEDKPDWDEGVYKFSKWKSPLFLPKKVARLFLNIKDIRIEKLQDISFSDILAEGIEPPSSDPKPYLDDREQTINFIYRFANLWDSIYVKLGNGFYTWKTNPLVWVYDFRKI